MDFSTTDVKAFKIVEIVEGNTTYARAEQVGIVPADQAVVVRSENGAGTYQIPVTQSTANFSDNLLMATLSPLVVTEENSIYCIALQNEVSGFFPVAVGTTIPKSKGYLDLSGSNVKPASIYFEGDDPTSLKDLKDLKDSKDLIYNLAGQRLNKPQRGINIIGGKAVLY